MLCPSFSKGFGDFLQCESPDLFIRLLYKTGLPVASHKYREDGSSSRDPVVKNGRGEKDAQCFPLFPRGNQSAEGIQRKTLPIPECGNHLYHFCIPQVEDRLEV